MNGRIHNEGTPEGRLAAVAQSLRIQIQERYRVAGCGPVEPDYADFAKAFRPYIQRELLMARIDEARSISNKQLTVRMEELTVQLEELYLTMPSEFRL
jgi:hypothetical protein